MTDNAIKILFEGNLAIEYSQFYLETALDPENEDDFLDPNAAFAGQKNGICGAAQSGKLLLVPGVQHGTIALLVELHGEEPPIDDSYGDIVEASLRVEQEPISLCQWAHEVTHELELPTGEYRVRYSIDGMDRDYEVDEEGDTPVHGQRYLVQLWNAALRGDEVLKEGSHTARYWHEAWAGEE